MWRGFVPTSAPKKRCRRGAESEKGGVNWTKLLKKGLISSFSAQRIWAEMTMDLFPSLKQQKAAVSYRKSFSLLLLWLPTGNTPWPFGLVPPGAGSGEDLLPFSGGNRKRVKDPESTWTSSP